MLIAAWVVEAADIYFYLRDEYPELRLMLLDEIAKVEAAGPSPHTKRASAPRRRRLHLRRRIRDDRIDRGQARPAAPSPALCRAGRPVRPPDAGAERRDALLDPRHRREGRGLVHLAGPPRAQGLPQLLGVGPRQESGRGAGARRHHHARTDRRILRRHASTATTFKGYLPGGASGGILPASMADMPLDFGTLEKYGCFVGSHAVVILSEQDDMKAVALNLMKFFEDESCGQCTPCRVGTEKAVKLMAAGPVGRGAADRTVDADARRLDLRPRPGRAESAAERAEVFPRRSDQASEGVGEIMTDIKKPVGYGHDNKGAAGGDDQERWPASASRMPRRCTRHGDAKRHLHPRRPRGACAAGETIWQVAQARRHRHSASVLLAQARLPRRRQLPRLHGRDRGRARARRELHPHARRRA